MTDWAKKPEANSRKTRKKILALFVPPRAQWLIHPYFPHNTCMFWLIFLFNVWCSVTLLFNMLNSGCLGTEIWLLNFIFLAQNLFLKVKRCYCELLFVYLFLLSVVWRLWGLYFYWICTHHHPHPKREKLESPDTLVPRTWLWPM